MVFLIRPSRTAGVGADIECMHCSLISIRQGVDRVYVLLQRYAMPDLVNAPRRQRQGWTVLKKMIIQGGGKGDFKHMHGILIKKAPAA